MPIFSSTHCHFIVLYSEQVFVLIKISELFKVIKSKLFRQAEKLEATRKNKFKFKEFFFKIRIQKRIFLLVIVS